MKPSKVFQTGSVTGGTAVVIAAPMAVLPDMPGVLLASVMATGVVMVFAGLSHGWAFAEPRAKGSESGSEGEL